MTTTFEKNKNELHESKFEILDYIYLLLLNTFFFKLKKIYIHSKSHHFSHFLIQLLALFHPSFSILAWLFFFFTFYFFFLFHCFLFFSFLIWEALRHFFLSSHHLLGHIFLNILAFVFARFCLLHLSSNHLGFCTSSQC